MHFKPIKVFDPYSGHLKETRFIGQENSFVKATHSCWSAVFSALLLKDASTMPRRDLGDEHELSHLGSMAAFNFSSNRVLPDRYKNWSPSKSGIPVTAFTPSRDRVCFWRAATTSPRVVRWSFKACSSARPNPLARPNAPASPQNARSAIYARHLYAENNGRECVLTD